MVRVFLSLALLSALAVVLPAQKPAAPAAAKKAAPKMAAAPKLDLVKLEAFLRHTNLWTPEIKVEFKEVVASTELKGFQEVTVKASLGERFAEQKYYVTADGGRVIQGNVFDTAGHPFAKEIAVINNAGVPSLGTAGAPVVVSLFTDFQCPYCKEEAQQIRGKLIQAYPKEVRLYFHDFPLEQIHPWARTAALAGRCAFLQGEENFWKYHDWAFEKQATLTADNFKTELMTWAPRNGLDVLQLTRCYDNKEGQPGLEKDLAMAKKLALASTPTLFVNGRKLSGTVRWEDLKRIIDFELKYQETAHNAGDTACCSVELKVPGGR
jgi:protein-disulfide isomerase